MDIEKICRTCLALSGPLLSIFDGSDNGGGSSCVADMISDFTKMKPKPMDNMPEKVCLTCISEINRCYSFKMKCQNANKTLLQLLPNAVDAVELELEQAKVEQQRKLVHKEVQTTSEEPKQMRSTPVQTVDVVQVQQAHQEVQTEIMSTDATTSPLNTKFKKPEKATIIKVERTVDLGEYEFTHANTKTEDTKNKKLKFKQLQLDDAQAHNDGEIIYELQSESGNDNNSSDYEMDTANQTELGEATEATTAYYVLSGSQPDEEFLANVEYECEGNNAPASSSNEHDQEAMHSQRNDYNFTIIQTEEGKEEITETDQSQEIHLQSKIQISVANDKVKCKVCGKPFVSYKNLIRHCIKMHEWTEAEVNNMQYLMDQQEQEQQEQEQEQTLDIVLAENMHASILQELQEEVVVEKVEGEEIKFEEIKFQQNQHTSIKTEYPLSVYCPRCNAGFAFTKALNYHLKQNQCTAATFTCEECQRVFTTEHGLEEHRESHLMQHACNNCNLMFRDKTELCQHLIKTHNRSDKNQCHICNNVFTMASALKDHLRIHTGEKPFKCTLCSKAFRQHSNLKQHIMRHSQTKPFSCDTCSQAFVSKAELFSHKRTHTGDHPFRCEFCDACYTTSSSLVKHRRKHTGERPYACEFCPMRFGALNVLKNHRRTHTGEKPFLCNFCNKRFTQKSDCQIHQRTHTGEKRYTCECGTSFTHLSTLRLHQKVHEGEDNGEGPVKKRRRAPPRTVKNGVELKIKEQLVTDEESNAMQHDADETLVVNDATADDEFMTLAINGMV